MRKNNSGTLKSVAPKFVPQYTRTDQSMEKMEQNLLQPKNHKISSSDLVQNNARRFLKIWEKKMS